MGLPLASVWARAERLHIEVSPSTIVASTGTHTGRMFYRDVQQVSFVEYVPEPANRFPRVIEGKPYSGECCGGFLAIERMAPPYLYILGTRSFMVIRRADEAATRQLYRDIQDALIAYTAN